MKKLNSDLILKTFSYATKKTSILMFLYNILNNRLSSNNALIAALIFIFKNILHFFADIYGADPA